MNSQVEQFPWWASLKHGGLLIAPSRLREFFSEEPQPIPRHKADRLRREITRLESPGQDITPFLDYVLEQVLGLNHGQWLKGPNVGKEWTRLDITRSAIKPRRVWLGPNAAVLPVFVDTEPKRIGIGRGRRSMGRVAEWLRRANQKIAVLTNARQWRLIYAGPDFEAWAEWDIDLWFEEGQPGHQVAALRTLLGARAITPEEEGEHSPLIAAILATRTGQAELSAELGERVRMAVELLIKECSPALDNVVGVVSHRDIYIAATRIIMRMVIVLFAEARDLLPRDNDIYHYSYSLQGLRELLDRVGHGAGAERLKQGYSAYPRIMALFRLIYHGSPHPALTIPRYGGGLFVPGDPGSKDDVIKALAAFEDVEHGPSDYIIHRILGLLCRARVKIRQARVSTWVEAPVDFSDLSSEYIGILYEGLLDFELRRTGADDPMVFLNLGDQPALPLKRLEAMDDKAIAALVKKFKTSSSKLKVEKEEEAEEKIEEDQEEVEEEADEEASSVPTEEEEPEDERQTLRDRASAWAMRAVKAGKLVKKPRSKKKEALKKYEQDCEEAAKALIKKVTLPGEWYLVRWGGTRKGSGTFYTRPQLAVPTVMRTLRPLAYQEDHEEWVPKKPEEILALKVCDPAMGSGSFLVASLRFLTDALFEALHHHQRIEAHGPDCMVTLAIGEPSNGSLRCETFPVPPEHENFDPLLRARLKRHVVENCIYGVDIDPLAVELARLALWIETMDRTLPFGFLDHKIKCGNSLVGCWFDHFRHYPALAFEREGGDKGHKGVHFPEGRWGDWTKAIKDFKNRIKPRLASWIESPPMFALWDETPPEALHDTAQKAFEEMHKLPIQDTAERARVYRERLEEDENLQRLKFLFDAWCALWFWPGNDIEEAFTPDDFYKDLWKYASMDLLNENLGPKKRIILETMDYLKQTFRFFHWELEFPDVFTREGAGFHAMVGNPPWEALSPKSMEFFSNYDPLYRTYGKQQALAKQKEYFKNSAEVELGWLEYQGRFKAMSNWKANAASPFGDPAEEGASRFTIAKGKKNAILHEKWREKRRAEKGYCDPVHPFRSQGVGDVNTYKLFLELSFRLLASGGRLGMIVPSGIYTDKGTIPLRDMFLKKARWEWIFGFENKLGIFDIHRQFKFSPVVIAKGGTTGAIRTAFMRHDLSEWEDSEPRTVDYARAQVERFSPNTRAILEIQSRRDLEILEKIYGHAVLLGDQSEDGWKIQYAREFDMTNDSHLFLARDKAEEQGFTPDEYGRWISPDNEIYLPLYEGRMIGQFDFSEKGWVSGRGRSAVWEDIPFSQKVLKPQYLMATDDYRARIQPQIEESYSPMSKVGIMDVTSATNRRTVIATYIGDVPAGHSAPVFYCADDSYLLNAIFCSFVYDYLVRVRLGGLHITLSVLEETALLSRVEHCTASYQFQLSLAAARLVCISNGFAPQWSAMILDISRSWKSYWAITDHERLRLRSIIDATIACLYGLDERDLSWILRDCDHPKERFADKAAARELDPKGFWRIDKDKDPELRHTVLTVAAFRDLTEKGLSEFLSQNHGEGWMIPETIKIRGEERPVRSRLGPRFLDWQLEGDPKSSWEECEMHAKNILGPQGWKRFQAELKGEKPPEPKQDQKPGSVVQKRLFPKPQMDMFGGDREDQPLKGKRGRKKKS